jgi:hypothetical protein
MDSEIPWPVQVLSDSTRADNWMWPDRDRWRVAALKLDQLPPKTNAADVATFRWSCFAPDCQTTCGIVSGANVEPSSIPRIPCRSPIETAGLPPGDYTFVIEAQDSTGRSIDLPQRYTWKVSTTHPAKNLRLVLTSDGVSEVSMSSQDSPTQIVTCSVGGRLERPCGSGLSISGIEGNGEPARELVVRVRARATGQEIFTPRAVHLNDPNDIDGDGWIDSADPCLNGAETAAACPP